MAVDWQGLGLSVDAVLFLGVVVLVGYEITKNRETASRDPDLATLSVGWGMRQNFHRLLFLGNGARFVALVVEIVVYDQSTPSSPAHLWLFALLHDVPDLFFFSSYSLVVMFLAQHYYSAVGEPCPRLRRVFLAANAAVYALFTLGTLVSIGAEAKAYARLTFSLLGGAYVGVLVALLVFGPLLARALAPLRNSDLPGRSKVVRRINTLCVLCGVIFALRVAYYLGNALDLFGWEYGYPGFNHYTFDTAVFLLTEWAPSAVVLALTRSSRDAVQPSLIDDLQYKEIRPGNATSSV